jgi:putative ABC transport system substrate-binding protein
MAINIARRKFIATLGGGAVWPLVVRAQQPDRIRLIGVLMGFAENDPTAQSMVAAFRDALAKLGWTEGSNVRIELRWSGYDRDRIKTLAKELVDLRPDVILGQTTPELGLPCSSVTARFSTSTTTSPLCGM